MVKPSALKKSAVKFSIAKFISKQSGDLFSKAMYSGAEISKVISNRSSVRFSLDE
jgi:hypothetical protein